MCEFFVKADPFQYEQRSRTVRMHGVLTSIRLENMVWNVLAEMAEAEGRTTNALISMFHDEIVAQRGAVPNFASFLRVTSLRYLARKSLAAETKLAQALALVPVLVLVPAAGAVAEPVGAGVERRRASGSASSALARPTLVPVHSRA